MENEISILIAKFAAVTYLVSGVALLNGSLSLKKTYKELKSSNMFTAMMGAFTLLLGMIIVNMHNIWVKDWTILVTIIGWILLAEGVFYMIWPKALLKLFTKLPQGQIGWGIFTILMGCLFGYFGFLI